MNCSKYHIKNVWIAKGDGSEPVRGEVLVSFDGKLLSCGPAFTACGEVIDGGGRILAPGFIDAHGHSDISVIASPGGFSKVSQGVTSEIAGNCGLSAFPLTSENREHLEELYANYNVPLEWHDLSSYKKILKNKKCVPEIIPLCGHNTLRAAAAGYDTKMLSPQQFDKMTGLLLSSLEQGAPGLSAGLLYVPGKFASEGENIELMKILAVREKIYAVHLASEGDRLLESLEETLDCAGNAGLKKVQISHFKTAGPDNWHKLSQAVEMILEARHKGIRVTVDRYPYTESMTQLSVILPGEWADLDDVTIGRRLQNSEEKRELLRLLEESKEKTYWDRVRLASTGAEKYRKFCGMKLPEISAEPAQLAVELLSLDASGTCGAFSGMSEENLDAILALDFCMPGSDGNALPADYSLGRAHPRSFGTVVRFMRRLLEKNYSIGETVRRASGLPAETFGLTDRGVLAAERRADLVLFDPDELEDTATFASPHTPARGIVFTMIGGEFVYRS